ncbi:hypothetical protein RhiirA5_479707 [Rhizophagus irregularis]|uniref:Uncharacterized protein n=1 Tax=Rhizophagus irregularis TaxID=588596 RepID=A0A2N0PL28_9GLOM|nr:hypothetical protein RhiirA5_479707 [Rhizophagus irregularis]
METQEIEPSATPSIQNKDVIQTETVINVNDDTSNTSNDTINNKIYNLYEQHVKKFGEFRKHFNLLLKNLFDDCFNNLNKNIKVETESIDSNNVIDVEDFRKNLEETFISQSKEIKSLDARIEELKSDSIVRDQDIEKFKQEFDTFKKKSRSLLKTTPTQNNRENSSLIMNEKEHNEKENSIGGSSTSQQSDKSKNKKRSNKQVHREICQYVNKHKNKPKKYKDNTFKYLRSDFTIEDLLKYEKSVSFHSLDDNVKESVRLSINGLLKEELTFRKRELSQPINVYIDRNLVPSLPSGVKSYNEFQKTREFDSLSDKIKIGIGKLILIEK